MATTVCNNIFQACRSPRHKPSFLGENMVYGSHKLEPLCVVLLMATTEGNIIFFQACRSPSHKPIFLGENLVYGSHKLEPLCVAHYLKVLSVGSNCFSLMVFSKPQTKFSWRKLGLWFA
jgi:hypothetical protein